MSPLYFDSPGPVLLLTATISTAILASIACNDPEPKVAHRAAGFAFALWLAAALAAVYIRKHL